MKRLLVLVLIAVLLTGCKNDQQYSHGLALRQDLLSSQGCSFNAIITADYGEKYYTFEMQCQTDPDGALSFQVIRPESISGITGVVSSQGGKLTFDDKALLFEMLADGQLTPVSSPWVMINALRGGSIRSGGIDGEETYLQIDDTFGGDTLRVDLWLSQDDFPVAADILYDGKRILSLEVTNFTFL